MASKSTILHRIVFVEIVLSIVIIVPAYAYFDRPSKTLYQYRWLSVSLLKWVTFLENILNRLFIFVLRLIFDFVKICNYYCQQIISKSKANDSKDKVLVKNLGKKDHLVDGLLDEYVVVSILEEKSENKEMELRRTKERENFEQLPPSPPPTSLSRRGKKIKSTTKGKPKLVTKSTKIDTINGHLQETKRKFYETCPCQLIDQRETKNIVQAHEYPFIDELKNKYNFLRDIYKEQVLEQWRREFKQFEIEQPEDAAYFKEPPDLPPSLSENEKREWLRNKKIKLIKIQREMIKQHQFTAFSINVLDENIESMHISDLKPKSFQFEIVKYISSGSFGSVYLCKQISTSDRRLYALKHFYNMKEFHHIDYRKKTFRFNELPILKSFEKAHRGIVWPQFFSIDGVIINDVLNIQSPDIIYPFINGKPLKTIFSHTDLYYNTAVTIISLLQTICYIHSNEIVHRDISMSNILLQRDGTAGTVLLGDFGTAVHLDKYRRSTEFPDLGHIVYTAEYRPPEVYEKRPYSKPADIWALGIVMFEMLNRKNPFKGLKEAEILPEIQRHYKFSGGYEVKVSSLCPYSEKFCEFISKVVSLSKDQDMEKSAVACIDLLVRLLQYDPAKRITAKEALKHSFFSFIRGIS